MFTGIVQAMGRVTAATEGALWVDSPHLRDAEIGASVAVDGTCLTVASRDGDTCRFDLSEETLQRTTLADRRPGEPVNIERPVLAGAELGGHVVQGHVDAVGAVVSSDPESGGRRMTLEVPPGLMRYIVEKGSVTVDGVSLTVTDFGPSGFQVACVPHTLQATTLGIRAAGDRVNIEVDILAKYVERLLTFKPPDPGQPDTGYL